MLVSFSKTLKMPGGEAHEKTFSPSQYDVQYIRSERNAHKAMLNGYILQLHLQLHVCERNIL